MRHKNRIVDHKTAFAKNYDVVIVGSGISGSIIAKELSKKGYDILILEAGPGKDLTLSGYEKYLNNFYSAVSKDNNAPYKRNPNAPMPRSVDVKKLESGKPNTDSYLVQNGPFISDFTYSRVVGGTTMHFESKTPRMLPEDFNILTRYGRGLDWPLKYEELMPYYRKAEFEMGVSGDVSSQTFSNEKAYEDGYVFPMQEMPPSYLDQCVAKKVNGTKINIAGEIRSLKIRTFPQGRNGIPNEDYKKFNNGELFRPVGAVSQHQAEEGERCQGNNNCTPICPVQAKYDARKTLAQALESGCVDILTRTVASRVVIDPVTQKVSAIVCKSYKDLDSKEYTSETITAKLFVLAANAVENARLMLASGLNSSSDLMGRNLMDHPYLLTWGLLPEIAGTTRGTICTSGISDIRNGDFRTEQAAFAVDIHNDGWGWATGSPTTNLEDIVDNKNKFGKDLRNELVHQISKQLLLANMVEMMPDPCNRITVNPKYVDQLGNPRPIVTMQIPEYTMKGIAYARQMSRQIFQRLGAEDYSVYGTDDYGYVKYKGEGYAIRGGNHLAGTHIMGTDATNSVVDAKQKSWDHSNLYLVGAGSMPTIGTSNTTLTLAALCFKSVDAILEDLKHLHSSKQISNQL
ncbi:GMC family oxidoreductase [Aquimarina pacifica]|uniref:GMC family oxidoreductase n=1 Tax=Aquimarina pacifica TaxID=1296415 RepID=UPI00046F5E9A|nr:GMC family oxidoreductase [Aquimarina pacifica]